MKNPFENMFAGSNPSPEEKGKKNLEALPPKSREFYKALRVAMRNPRAVRIGDPKMYQVQILGSGAPEFVIRAVPPEDLSEFREAMGDPQIRETLLRYRAGYQLLKYPAFIAFFPSLELDGAKKELAYGLRGDDFGIERLVTDVDSSRKPDSPALSKFLDQTFPGTQKLSGRQQQILASEEIEREREYRYQHGDSKPSDDELAKIFKAIRSLQ